MQQSTKRAAKGVERGAVWGTFGLVALAAWTSFTHLADVATRSGVPHGQGWVWPTMVDGAALIGSLAALNLAGDRGARRYAWGVVWANLGLSMAGNVLVVLMPVEVMPIGVRVFVACIPPIELMVCLHLWLIQKNHLSGADAPPVPVHDAAPAPVREVAASPVPAPVHDAPPVPVEAEAAPAWVDAPLFGVAAAVTPGPARVTVSVPPTDDDAQGDPAHDDVNQVERFIEWVEAVRAERGPDRPSHAEAGEWLGVSKSTGGRWLARYAPTSVTR